MMHEKRHYQIAQVEDPATLARKLADMTWCGCNGFELRGVLFLNDAFSPDGAQEYAVLTRRSDGRLDQIESITFSWCTEDEARRYIDQCVAGAFERIAGPFTLRIETPEEHGRCRLCA